LYFLIISQVCGASLIDNEWLVTAAHCIYGMSTGRLKVYLGIHTLNRMESTTVMRLVQKIIQHPSYNPQTLNNDIALLKISAVSFSNTVSPICLPKQGDNVAQPGKTGFVTGWGKVIGYGSTSDVLRQVNINVIRCPFSNANMICAGQQAPSIVHDSCQGDSGGPFAIKQGSNYYLSGIVSWGSAECSGDGVYTNVSNYINWINTIKQNN
jgi:trypsin